MTSTTASTSSFAHAKNVTLRALVDFISVRTGRKVSLPTFDGRVVWPNSLHGEVFTLHDPSEDDLVRLAREFGRCWIHEIEVSVDVRPRPDLRGPAGTKVICDVMVGVIAAGLAPAEAAQVSERFRAAYRRLEGGYKVLPFNFKLPEATDQQLHGGQGDAVQVKAYFKRTDNRKALEECRWVARLEVALRGNGPLQFGLKTCADLVGFRFRKALMPCFVHVRGARARRAGVTDNKFLIPVLDQKDQELERTFREKGCGPFSVGGGVDKAKVRLLRHTAVNNRIGQALKRLEDRMREAELRAFSATGDGRNPSTGAA